MSKKRKSICDDEETKVELSRIKENQERLARFENFVLRQKQLHSLESKGLDVIKNSVQKRRFSLPLPGSKSHIQPNLLADQVVLIRKKLYPWSNVTDDYPAHIDDTKFPEIENLSLLGVTDLHTIFSASEAALHAVSLFPNYSSFEEIPIMGTKKEILEKIWEDDSFFGYMRFAGPNPTLLKRYTSISQIPSEILLNVKELEQACKSNETMTSLADALEQGSILFEDHTILNNIHEDIIGPIILFYQDSKQQLKPFFIQFGSKTFSPYTSTPEAWLYAKLISNSAYFIHHELISHLLETHLLMEISIVATYQTLPPLHPVTGLLTDHFYRTLVINHSARSTLVPKLIPMVGIPSAVSQALIKKVWTTSFQWQQMHFLNHLKTRLYPDEKKVETITLERIIKDFPTYYYLHDALQLWNIIHEYHTQVLMQFYKQEDSLKKDTYLQAFLGQLKERTPGFPNVSDIDVKQLIDIVTSFTFLSTVQHSAVNYSQETYFQNVRSCPMILKYSQLSKLPIDKITKRDLIEAFPNKFQTSIAYALVTILSAPVHENSIKQAFGSYTHEANTDHSFDIHLFYQDKILQPGFQSLKEKIQKRTLLLPYNFLLPDQIAKSILI